MPVPPLPEIMIEPAVRAALLEDLGRAGDITTDAIVPQDARGIDRARRAKSRRGRRARLRAARVPPRSIATIRAEVARPDGSAVAKGEVIATISGPTRGILSAERVALNFLCHLSGIASAAASIVAAIKPHKARLVCTRKTTPGLRALQKYAVRVGGGFNHRFGLDDGVLIKDNHIAAAGSLGDAVARARAAIGHLVKIEVEVDTLAQLEEALRLEIDAVLLDNMSFDEMRRAVAMVDGRAVVEASGRHHAADRAASRGHRRRSSVERLAHPLGHGARYRPRLALSDLLVFCV